MALTLASYEVCVDWNNDDDFLDADEDISADARELSWIRGRDAELDKTEIGDASVIVVDTAGKYIPQNTASPLYGNLKPGRQLRIRATHNAVTYDLFRGHLDDILPEPHIEEQRAILPCLDGLDRLARERINMGLQKNKKSGPLFTEAADQAGWNAVRRAFDAGIDPYPLVFTERLGCRNFLDRLALSEFGFVYVDGRGYLVWEDRTHRHIPPHTVSQWVCSAGKYVDIEPMSSFKTVRNAIIIEAQPYIPNAAVVELWRLWENKDNVPADSPILRAGEVYDYWAKFTGIADNVVAPAATVDYLGNTLIDGSGADKTAKLTVVPTIFAQSARIRVTNTDVVDFYLTMLKIRGELYDMPQRLAITEEDAASIAEYGYIDLIIPLPYYTSSQAMRDMAKYQLGLKRSPWHRYRIELVGDTDEILTQILARKLSDRITLQNAAYNIDDDFHIDKMEHQVGEDGIHRCRWTLVRADDLLYWIWDVSKWDDTTVWGY